MSRALLLWLLLAMLPAPKAAGDTLQVLDESGLALQTRLDLIRNAHSRLDVAMYWWREDPVGLKVAALLQQAAARGVRVRVLIDSMMTWLSDPVLLALADTPGLELRVFSPFNPLHLGRFDFRLHEKLLISDRGAMLIGGRNHVDLFYECISDFAYFDRDLLAQGAVAKHTADYFDRLWNYPMVDPCEPRKIHPDPKRSLRTPGDGWLRTASAARRKGQRLLDQALETNLSFKVPPSRSPVFEVPADRIRVMEDQPLKQGRPSQWLGDLIELFDQAQKELWIESPWVVLTEATRGALQRARARGVSVHLVTNSLPACRDILVFAAHERDCRELQRLGVEVWQMPGVTSLHGKTIVADGRIASIGTFNLDPRSENLNREMMVEVRDGRFASHLVELIKIHRAGAHPFSHCEGRCLERQHPSFSIRLKRAAMPLFRCLLPVYRSHL